MTIKEFPKKFIFGTALASYQVEGGIYNNDWTHWENRDNSVCAEPCNEACKHYEYYKGSGTAVLKLATLQIITTKRRGS